MDEVFAYFILPYCALVILSLIKVVDKSRIFNLIMAVTSLVLTVVSGIYYWIFSDPEYMVLVVLFGSLVVFYWILSERSSKGKKQKDG